MSDDKKLEFVFIKLTSSKISPLIALWCSFKYWLATSTDCEIAVEIFLLNHPLNAVSKIKIEEKAINRVGVNVIAENITSNFFWSSCPAFFNFKLLKISKEFLIKILDKLSIIKKDIARIKINKFLRRSVYN